MSRFFKKLFVWGVSFPYPLLPRVIRKYVDPQRLHIDRFFHQKVRPLLTPGERVLDAGAGPQRYKAFLSDVVYESTDFEDVFAKETKGRHDFVCSLDAIPKEDETYDAILNTEVLEHVPDPQKVIDEFYRVLKPGGKLFLTTPQMFPVHGAPYNFFFFSRYGLRSMFEKSGFTVRSITPNGGIFIVLAKVLADIPLHLFFQAVYGGHRRNIHAVAEVKSYTKGFLLLPLYMLARIFLYALPPPILFFLDRMDGQKDYTLGYCCICVKES